MQSSPRTAPGSRPGIGHRTSGSQTDPAQQRFVRAAMRVPLLSREDEADLARRWKTRRDETALHRLTEAHIRLVVAIAAKYKRYGLALSDLIQEGNIGLMKAAERFDPERDIRFATYASWWIRSSVQDHVLRNWSIVRTGTTSAQKSLFFSLRRVRARIGDLDGGGLVSPENRRLIAHELRVSENDVDTMAARLAAGDRSLNAPIANAPAGDDALAEWQDFIADEAPAPEETVMRRTDSARRNAWLGTAIGTLSPREQMIVRERRLSDEAPTLECLGNRLGISKERVRQIESAALDKLRTALVDQVGDPFEAGLLPG